MPEARLRRTREAYQEPEPELPRWVPDMFPMTNDKTGHTSVVRIPQVFVPYGWNVIEGEPHE